MYMIVCDTYDNIHNDERYDTEYVGVCMEDEVEYIMEDLSNAYHNEYGSDNTYIKYGKNYCDVEFIANDTLWKSMCFYGVDISDGRFAVMRLIVADRTDCMEQCVDLMCSTDSLQDAYDVVYMEYMDNIERPDWPFKDEPMPDFTGWDDKLCKGGHASLVNRDYVVDIRVVDIRGCEEQVINY